MLTSQEALHTRPLGQYPISISTSLAFERLKGIHPDFELKKGEIPPYVNYDNVHINVRTLIRNCFTCMKSEDAYNVKSDDMANTIAEEMGLIETIVSEQLGNRFTCSYYFVSYENLSRQFPDANLKPITTDKQMYYARLEEEAVTKILRHPFIENFNYEKTDLKTKLGSGRALMLTHLPIDILVAKYSRYKLLESHTGGVRSTEMMTNKLRTVKVDTIPFDIMTIQFFGDTGSMFSPQPMKFRRVLENIANKYKWNKTTTRSRILANIKMENEPHLYDYIKKLYRAPR